MNLRGDIAGERANDFWPRGSSKAKMQGWSRSDAAIKQTIVSKQTKIAELVRINVIISS
jgi:hypothetical protein